jgi:hypothetical protein
MVDESKESRDGRLPELGPGGGDRTAAVIRSVISNVPIVGQTLAEIITELIPNQRIERVEGYLKLLAMELDELKVSAEAAKVPESIDLIEDGAYQAVRALSEERRQYLARAVATGIAEDEKHKIKAKRVLSIISELDDGYILLLDSFNGRSDPESHRRSFDKFQNLAPERPVIGAPTDVIERWQLHEASLARLERLLLLNKYIRIDHETKLPHFDQFTGEPEGHLSITALGKLILVRIGFGRESRQSV